MSGLTIALIVLAVIMFAVGFLGIGDVVIQTATFAAAAVLAIFARIAQAGRQHAELMDELLRR